MCCDGVRVWFDLVCGVHGPGRTSGAVALGLRFCGQFARFPTWHYQPEIRDGSSRGTKCPPTSTRRRNHARKCGSNLGAGETIAFWRATANEPLATASGALKLCHDSLPPTAREQLKWSALLAISSIGEVNLRARVAMAAVSEGWPLGKVREVVAQAQGGRVWDTESETPGLQLPEPKPAAAPQPGRLVTRTEKWTEEVGQWQQEFDRIDASKLSKVQVERVRAAVATLRGQLDAVEKRLG